MTVRKMAYDEVMAWLDADDDSTLPEPQPTEGLHPLALAEWMAGAAEAHAAFEKKERGWTKWENRAVWAAKTVALASCTGLVVAFPDNLLVAVPALVVQCWLFKRWL